MPDILIRGLDKKVLQRLKARAKRNGRSLQSEAKTVIENAAQPSILEALEDAQRMRKQLGRTFGDNAELIREDRRR
jgi:plasmid stability protein